MAYIRNEKKILYRCFTCIKDCSCAYHVLVAPSKQSCAKKIKSVKHLRQRRSSAARNVRSRGPGTKEDKNVSTSRREKKAVDQEMYLLWEIPRIDLGGHFFSLLLFPPYSLSRTSLDVFSCSQERKPCRLTLGAQQGPSSIQERIFPCDYTLKNQ